MRREDRKDLEHTFSSCLAGSGRNGSALKFTLPMLHDRGFFLVSTVKDVPASDDSLEIDTTPKRYPFARCPSYGSKLLSGVGASADSCPRLELSMPLVMEKMVDLASFFSKARLVCENDFVVAGRDGSLCQLAHPEQVAGAGDILRNQTVRAMAILRLR